MSITPTKEIAYTGEHHVEMVVTCEYPASEDNTAERVWGIVRNFTDLKTIFKNIMTINLEYPSPTEDRIDAKRHMTFHPEGKATEQLKALDDEERSLTYVSLDGLPVENYVAVMKVTGDNACALTWTVNYNSTQQTPEKKKFAEFLAGSFAGGELQIATALGLS